MEQNNSKKASDHLANERTFLAWIRTSMAIMAFGFVVVKFSLFVRQLTAILGKDHVPQEKGYSGIAGIVLVVCGLLTTLFAYVRFKKTEAQIDSDTYKTSLALIVFITLFILIMGVLLIGYLIKNIY